MFVFYDGTQADTHTSRMGDVLGAVGEWASSCGGAAGVYTYFAVTLAKRLKINCHWNLCGWSRQKLFE